MSVKAQITIKPEDVKAISRVARQYNKKQWFLAKDSGAYVGINTGQDENFEPIIHYFRGCDPSKDEDYYENARHKFGGDDFAEMMDISFVHQVADHPKNMKLVIRITDTAIDASGVEVRS